MQLRLGGDMVLGLADDDREQQPDRDKGDAEIERLRTETVACSDEAGREGDPGDGDVAGEVV